MSRGNVTAEDQAKRRQQVKECWARGMRSPYAIGAEVGCHGITVQKDLIILKRQAQKDPITEERLHLIREQIAAGYESDIAELDEIIKEARQYLPVRKETNTNTESEKVTEVDGKLIVKTKTREIVFPKDYTAIAHLFNRKLEARRKLAELYELMEPETKKMLVEANATATAEANINFQEINDSDLIAATKGVLSRISSQN